MPAQTDPLAHAAAAEATLEAEWHERACACVKPDGVCMSYPGGAPMAAYPEDVVRVLADAGLLTTNTEWALEFRERPEDPYETFRTSTGRHEPPYTEAEARHDLARLTTPTAQFSPENLRLVSRGLTAWKPAEPVTLTTTEQVLAQEPGTVLLSATNIVYTLGDLAPLWDRPGRRNGTDAHYIELPATVLHVPAQPSAADQLHDALEEVGLPASATLADLIAHHRGNAGLAAALQSLAAVPARAVVPAPEVLARALLGADPDLDGTPQSHQDQDTTHWRAALRLAEAAQALTGVRTEAEVRDEHLRAVIVVLEDALAFCETYDHIAPEHVPGWNQAIANLRTVQSAKADRAAAGQGGASSTS